VVAFSILGQVKCFFVEVVENLSVYSKELVLGHDVLTAQV